MVTQLFPPKHCSCCVLTHGAQLPADSFRPSPLPVAPLLPVCSKLSYQQRCQHVPLQSCLGPSRLPGLFQSPSFLKSLVPSFFSTPGSKDGSFMLRSLTDPRPVFSNLEKLRLALQGTSDR